MVFIPLAAGYVAYRYAQNERRKLLAVYDPSINLDGKKAITLMEAEQELGIAEHPITTVTFFDGNIEDVAPLVEKRVRKITEKNPWLGGWLIMDAADNYEIKLFYDESGVEGNTGLCFQVVETKIPLIRGQAEYERCVRTLSSVGAIIASNQQLLGKHNQPLWKITLVPDAELPHERFALVVSMSHALGDAATYYALLNMLDQRDEREVVALDPVRIPNFRSRLVERIGNEREVDYIRSAVAKPVIDLSGTKDQPCVFKMFYVSRDWVLLRKHGRAEAEAESIAAKQVVSSISVLTSWFFSVNEASVGLLLADLRGQIEECPIGDANAGNYVHFIPYTPSDYRTPTLVHDSLSSMKRCGPNSEQYDMPGFMWDMTASLSADWSRYFREEMYLGDDVKYRIHLPVCDSENLRKVIPSRVSYMTIFTANPHANHNVTLRSICADNVTASKREAAMVLCRQSVWDKINECGVVEEVIAEL